MKKSEGAIRVKRYRENNPRRYLFHKAAQQAKCRGLKFSLVYNDIPEIPEFCPIFPWIRLTIGKSLLSSPTIDRIDSSRGYVKGNIRVVSFRANVLRGDGSLKEFQALVKDARKCDLIGT
jgi:hypothetical protein